MGAPKKRPTPVGSRNILRASRDMSHHINEGDEEAFVENAEMTIQNLQVRKVGSASSHLSSSPLPVFCSHLTAVITHALTTPFPTLFLPVFSVWPRESCSCSIFL
jgi:hypothetical protein